MARPTAVVAGPRTAAPPSPDPFLYRTLVAPVRQILARVFDLSVEGLEHLPAAGPYIIAANHHNYLDGVVLAAVVPTPIAFLVMPRVYRATPLHPIFHRHIGSIPITLERPDLGAVRRAVAALEAGRVVGIFPEGPFSLRGQLEAGLPGVGLLALRSRASVVPAAIRGTYEALHGRRFYIPRRAPISIRFGPPRRFAGDGTPGGRNGAGNHTGSGAANHPGSGAADRVGGGRDARLRVTARVMDDIAALLA
jgi:1-acyl-sn-glycerol-3-phosphate acyltransferase